ncbi:MAG: hypothetical protein GY791_20610 [Alphaproteobacteria bacterium]|nr:hypothetical protein [Alphaproteobacteria bacterium]
MESLLGSSVTVFVGLTVILLGFAAFMTGQGLALTWRPISQAFPYSALLGLANRFFAYSLFDGELLSISGFVVCTAVLTAICLFGYRLTRVRQMVRQYPWLYVQSTPLSWRKRG